MKRACVNCRDRDNFIQVSMLFDIIFHETLFLRVFFFFFFFLKRASSKFIRLSPTNQTFLCKSIIFFFFLLACYVFISFRRKGGKISDDLKLDQPVFILPLFMARKTKFIGI